ncbi:hypothetical protein OS493_020054 [Desmophyllum pertusum]|uniref:Uncharacterized protein n=1 Tax=Desmophyllum pertusum TaxID=174260 RepID=A0A9W9YEQ5_9CNID|nr:hypothetical protein OS493_020054 [Desmophyllum pertusum]
MVISIMGHEQHVEYAVEGKPMELTKEFSQSVLPEVGVPAQRLVYKFNRLPYKYEPGVTRSLRHAKQINASITNEQDQKPVTPKPPQITTGFSSLPSAFIPTSTPVSKGRPWPVMPMPTRPVWWYPGSSPLALKPPVFSTGSSIMFPLFNPLTSLPLGFKPVERVSPVYEVFPLSNNTSVPVSVIQRTA